MKLPIKISAPAAALPLPAVFAARALSSLSNAPVHRRRIPAGAPVTSPHV